MDVLGDAVRSIVDHFEKKKRYKWVQARRRRTRRKFAKKLIALDNKKEKQYQLDLKRVKKILHKSKL